LSSVEFSRDQSYENSLADRMTVVVAAVVVAAAVVAVEQNYSRQN